MNSNRTNFRQGTSGSFDAPRRAGRAANTTSSAEGSTRRAGRKESKAVKSGTSSSGGGSRFAAFAAASEHGAAELDSQTARAAVHPTSHGMRQAQLRRELLNGPTVQKTSRPKIGAEAVELARALGVIR